MTDHSSPDDICADCGLPRREHHHDGAAYGRCGQFSEVDHRGFEPGTHGCHEALHIASVLIDLVERELIEHEAMRNPVWLAHAKRAQEALMDLYNAIGREHLT